MSAIANTIFSPELAARFDKLVTIYPVKRSALVPMLLYAQDEIGYVSEAVIQEIAKRLDLFDLEVRSVLSYYSMLRTKPAGKYNIQVCTNISCMVGTRFSTTANRSSALDTNKPRPMVSSRWKKSSALGRAAGLRRCR
jgi:NADH:ubiquinone oxidoreductase subunit E